VIRGPGVVGPLDRLADVGPSEARASDRSALPPPSPPNRPDAEALEARLEKWFVERERFERRARPGAAATPGTTTGKA
jgi:hypothetical protein